MTIGPGVCWPLLASLKRTRRPPSDLGYQVKAVPICPGYYVGRSAEGLATLLIETESTSRTIPLRLAGLEAHYSIVCLISEQDHPARTETLTAITCLDRDAAIEGYFATLADTMIARLGPGPKLSTVTSEVDRLVSLFQKLKKPAQRGLTGLIGELCIIRQALDVIAAIDAWRADSSNRYDFAVGALRLEVKATVSRNRIHELSLEQADPPTGTTGLLASVFIEPSGGGQSLAELIHSLEKILVASPAHVGRLRENVAEALGDTLPQALQFRFDLHQAVGSMRYFDLHDVPAIRPPLPEGVSAVRFSSDLGNCTPLEVAALREQLSDSEAAILPR